MGRRPNKDAVFFVEYDSDPQEPLSRGRGLVVRGGKREAFAWILLKESKAVHLRREMVMRVRGWL